MESIYQHRVAGRRTYKYDEVKQALLSCSNAIYTTTDSFAGLSPDTKSLLGIKKALNLKD